ncbi:hypothetical protein [Actinomadura rubrisoli]|uniref:EF-hand domain-containing protein n=1 Tax=Actinomadura rubrisoli TaxID=2530368 RepID=A0A4V2YVM3_9ACTN|nr:hypothetical protein [Actinomadura rubrisoli]TDD81987.1 hypothetical protein E1298_23400 [Actinomadura rubrisoli]
MTATEPVLADLRRRKSDRRSAPLDRDGDGRDRVISGPQVQRLLEVRGVDAGIAFARLDRDRSGFVSRAKLPQAVREFYCSDDPEAPGDWLNGPA